MHMATTLDSSTTQTQIPFADPVPPRRRLGRLSASDEFGIWSCKFSADGNEVVAGGNGRIFGK